jgi:hypothetical protein
MEELKNEVDVVHRTRTRIQPIMAKIHVNDSFTKIVVRFPEVDDEDHEIDISEIDFIKRRDFSDVDAYNQQMQFHLLSLTHKDGNHTSVQFKEATRRDAWETGLRTMISGASAGQSIGEVKVPKEQYQPIKSLTTETPQEDELLRLTVSLGKRSAVLTVKKFETTAKDWKRVTDEFVEANAVLPTEATSLYRYIRSVIDRTIMEREVLAVIEEINSKSFEALSRNRHGSSATDEELVKMANDSLTTLASTLPTRVGSHGNGGMVICQILHRNIEKMKLINDMAVRVARHDGRTDAVAVA